MQSLLINTREIQLIRVDKFMYRYRGSKLLYLLLAEPYNHEMQCESISADPSSIVHQCSCSVRRNSYHLELSVITYNSEQQSSRRAHIA